MANRAASGHRSVILPGGNRALAPTERLWLYAVFALLWMSGIGWLALNWWFSTVGEFGTIAHPWQAPLLLIHGVVAVPSLYLIGWVASRHAGPQWRAGVRRRSGGSFAVVLSLLSVSGFALFFLTAESLQRLTADAHEIIGALFTAFVLEHWFIGRRAPRYDG